MDRFLLFILVAVSTLLSGCFEKKNPTFADLLPNLPFHTTPYGNLSEEMREKVPVDRYDRCMKWVERQKHSKFFKFFYSSQNHQVSGVLGQPRDLKEKHPLLIINRSGVGDVGMVTACTLKKKFYPFLVKDFVVVSSQLKGNDGGTGVSDYGPGDLEDIRGIVEVAGTLPYVDKNKIFMIGEGRGGVLSLRAASVKFPIRAIAVSSLPYSLSQYNKEKPDHVERVFSKLLPDYPKNIEASLAKLSVVSFVEQVGVPVISFHGASDRRIDVEHGRKLAKALKKKSERNKYIEYPDSGNSMKAVRAEMYQEVMAFFEDYL